MTSSPGLWIRPQNFIYVYDVYLDLRVLQSPYISISMPCLAIDLLHKSQDAPVPYPTMHHFVTCVDITVTKWYIMKCVTVHYGVCKIGVLPFSFFFVCFFNFRTHYIHQICHRFVILVLLQPYFEFQVGSYDTLAHVFRFASQGPDLLLRHDAVARI